MFRTSLSRESVPPSTAGWKFNTSAFPEVKQADIEFYQRAKRQGKHGQYWKAQRMFLSRRMKTTKVLRQETGEVYVKANVLKSFSMEVTRSVIILFHGNTPQKAYCECAVGVSGLWRHAILVLLQLKHFNE